MRQLILALVSTERLYLIFKKASYFDPVAPRALLDSLWGTALSGQWPPKLLAQAARKFARSEAIPDEEDCLGTDFYGLSFVSCLDILADPNAREDAESLAYISEEIEINLLDHYLSEQYYPIYTLPTDELEAKIASDSRMQRLCLQLASDKARVATMSIEKEALEELKKQAVFDILS